MSNFTTYISAECRIQITFSKAPGFSKFKRGARFGDQTKTRHNCHTDFLTPSGRHFFHVPASQATTALDGNTQRSHYFDYIVNTFLDNHLYLYQPQNHCLRSKCLLNLHSTGYQLFYLSLKIKIHTRGELL